LRKKETTGTAPMLTLTGTKNRTWWESNHIELSGLVLKLFSCVIVGFAPVLSVQLKDDKIT